MAEGYDDVDDLFEQTGPYEPITTRIRNILREYKDGVGIFKELIQNADDAGATTVKFLVDWRQGDFDNLFSPGMAECQGPALWSYNDAVFTNDDLENITKLAGETKVEDLSKIGRFGLGFNAVYHVTDVPSLITREFFNVYDPNTTHLQRLIKDRSRPGVRINLAKKSESLSRYQGQFQLYDGIFGCNTAQARSSFHYNGTLFRFPFRTARQAAVSDISKVAYDRTRIQAIVCSLCECASTLLIFSQHVKEVKLYELDESCHPHQMRSILSVNKPSAQAFSCKGISSNEPFIKQCSKWWQKFRDTPDSCTVYPSGCELVNIITTKAVSKLSRCDNQYTSNEMWFVASASGTCTSLKIAREPDGRRHGLLPCGGAACIVQRSSEHAQDCWESSVASDFPGELFCFLPLSIPTGLPVHVNGYFAIMSNRVEIWKRTSLRSQPIEVLWNEALMEDALAGAYVLLLENMKEFHGKVQDYKFHTLWPNSNIIDMKSWGKLVEKVCSVLLHKKFKLFHSDGNWMSIDEGFLLNDAFDAIFDTAVEVLKMLKKPVFNMPNKILHTLQNFDEKGILKRRTLTFEEFMKTYFFPNLDILPSTHRDVILCFALDRLLEGKKSQLFSLMQRNACIPISETGGKFVKPSQLIHPYGNAASLFSESDNRFPVGNGLREDNRLYVLERLGMISDLSWEQIYERAQSISSVLGFVVARTDRPRKLMEYLNQRIDHLPAPGGYLTYLRRLKILPALTKRENGYLLPWKGSQNILGYRMCAANDLFLPKDINLIGSTCYIVDTSDERGCGELSARVKDVLGFSSRVPDDKFVIQQLDEAIRFWSKHSNAEKRQSRENSAVASVCQKIYEHFNGIILDGSRNQNFLKELRKRHWLFVQGKFVESQKVAYTSNGNGAPFLFTLPPNYVRNYRHLLEAMQVKESFDDEDYITALYELQSATKGNPLTDSELQIAIFFIAQIDVEAYAVKNNFGNIPLPGNTPLPDTNKILHPCKDLVVNLDLWLSDPKDNLKVHKKIPPETAYNLGTQSLKNIVVKECSSPFEYGESFGQYEKLTDRLKGILDGYPPDGVLKELVQNADDAQASEIHFIHDTRYLGWKKVATKKETSEEIQGPALCVYNDKAFTKDDLEGIKQLGTGSKRKSFGMTGKYGIGFNSVYHLTDCPSFLSNNKKLVFLDPHRWYVPGAKSDAPGILLKVNELRKHNLTDTLDGYLADNFDLEDSTMFRFPLRRNLDSEISNKIIDMEDLLNNFQMEARKSLLFLNHVKKITLSRMDADEGLRELYRVETVITPQNEKKRQEMTRKIGAIDDTPTANIVWEGINYTLTIEENGTEVEKWLVQKCIGSTTATCVEIPEGRDLGLLPRGGLAARIWARPLPSGQEPLFQGIVYCFLPLPQEGTNLPVHVNGHFALDGTRRGLWTDTDGKELKSKWNNFMKCCVLPPAYAALIIEARKHLCNDQNDNHFSRYHALFPNVSNNSWKILAVELYRHLGRTSAKVLPLLTPTEPKNEMSLGVSKLASSLLYNIGGLVTTHLRTTDAAEAPVHFTCTKWLSVEEGYFRSPNVETANEILHLLIRIGLPVLLHAQQRIHRGFKSAHITLNEVTPRSVTDFLRCSNVAESTCKIFQLPKALETTVVKSIPELSLLINYCSREVRFGKLSKKTNFQLEALPLLLTHDGFLRVFDSRQPVFGSEFGGLFPTQSHLFLHSQLCHVIALVPTENKKNVVREFTVGDLADFLPHVFTAQRLRDIKDHETWKFPVEGVLSEKWLVSLWDYLQNYAKSEDEEDFVSLECLSAWPLIPTKCGKLVKIKNAKGVLDMTVTGNELATLQKVCTFLSKLDCPILRKEITFPDKHLSHACGNTDQTTRKQIAKLERKAAVTDPYVAHPHNVVDVLVVLFFMLRKNQLDITKVGKEEIHEFLKFVKENYKASNSFKMCKEVIKLLPFHKRLDGEFTSLVGQYSSYALIPTGVPLDQLKELEDKADCLFLDSDALPALEGLYSDLGVGGGKNVLQFYVEYIFKHFGILTRENQMKHLLYIRDEIHPSLPQGHSNKKKVFLNSMIENPCIPDELGDLHYAWEYYDVNNEVFKIMMEDENFPPLPFTDDAWFDLLKDIGLCVDITTEMFLQFCNKVADDGKYSPRNQQNRSRSKVLVKCFFCEKGLQERAFTSQLSQIKFIAPAKLDENLNSIHQQYQENGYPPFLKFRSAVPWSFRSLVWTTASVLPIWAQPNMYRRENLGIAWSGPECREVVDHLKNLIHAYDPRQVDGKLMYEITKEIYGYLQNRSGCQSRNPTGECSNVCMDIGVSLQDIPCIYLQEDEVFVKGEQLIFKLSENSPLKPFLYPVPVELADLTHFLKRLGATNEPKPLQLAYVLNAIHDQVGDEVLPFAEENKSKYAMHLLFELLYKGEKADTIDEVYLPSQSKQLIKSCDMVCKVSSRFTAIIEKLQRPILLRFEECKLKKVADEYINALPENIRPVRFEELIREEVDPECKISICSKSKPGLTCDFEKRLKALLRSDEFQEGLKRLLMHDRQDPKKFEHKLKKLQTDVELKCCGKDTIKIQVIDRESCEVLDKLDDSCYAVEDDETWFLYMQHEFEDDKTYGLIASCVNKILGNCIRMELMLAAMLSCSSSDEIAEKLNKRDITHSLSKSADDFTPPEDDLFPDWDNESDTEMQDDDGFGGGSDGHRGGKKGSGGKFGFRGRGYGVGATGGGGGHTSSLGDEDGTFFPMNRAEATRWVEQSKCDLKAAKWLLESETPLNAHACFQCHEIVEKSFKAMLFADCGIFGGMLKSHRMDELGPKVREETEMPDEVIRLAEIVERYYLSTRFPNRQPFNVVPAEAFNREEAETAIDAASKVLEYVKDYLQEE